MIKGLRKLVDGKVFQGVILFVILFNCLLMGLVCLRARSLFSS